LPYKREHIWAYGKQISTYHHLLLIKNSTGNYAPTIYDLINNKKGNFYCIHFNTQIDISLGMNLF